MRDEGSKEVKRRRRKRRRRKKRKRKKREGDRIARHHGAGTRRNITAE